MSSTLTPTCPLCGLRYNDRSLLDLHIREDHVQRDQRPPQHDPPGDTSAPGDTGTPAPLPPPRVARSGWVATAWRAAATTLTRAIRALRHVNSSG